MTTDLFINTWGGGTPVVVELASYPKLVVLGCHSAGFDAICDDLADQIAASRTEVEGAGHEIQLTGPPINNALVCLWRAA